MTNNTNGLIAFRADRSKQKRDSVLKAIDALLSNSSEINFLSVAKKAGVSRKYLYGQEDFAEKIRQLKPASIEIRKNKVAPFKASDQGKENKIKALSNRCNRLLKENNELKSEILVLRNHIDALTYQSRT